VAVLNHYFHPDDVVSARLFADFCVELARRGWDVVARPCNRGWWDESLVFPLLEDWQGVTVRRLWRPRFRQGTGLGRVLNAAWMLAGWCLSLAGDRRHAPDVVVVGTDPVLSVLVAPAVRALRPQVRFAHWCFDLYPEAPVAAGMMRGDGWPARGMRRLLRSAYASCDLVADLGRCMRGRLEWYGHTCRKATLVPWALAEPETVERPDPATRRELFGDSRLGVLYSGNFGRAHSFVEALELARRLRGTGVHFCFGVRGNRAEELRAAVRPDDSNVTLAGFAPETELVQRLSAADVHLVSLRPEWTGLVVPSKFFGSLASGRPVIFAGSREAAIARWIEEDRVGWVLDPNSVDAVAAQLRALAHSPLELQSLQQQCHRVYHQRFSRRCVMDEWDRLLRDMLPPSRSRPESREDVSQPGGTDPHALLPGTAR
jgi:glycosyltransferase involved in cell wall biosynthesis